MLNIKLLLKKIPAILLLLLILYQMVGYYSVHQLQVCQIKKEIKRKLKKNIPKDELVVISFALSESTKIPWVKKNKELIFEKKMFDVVETKRTNDSITFYCIHDFKETAIFAQLEDYVNSFMSSNPDQQKKSSQLFKRFHLEYFSSNNSKSELCNKKNNKIRPLQVIKNYTVFQMVESPPPKSC